MSDLDDITVVLSPSERYLSPRQLQDYRAEREACLEWLLTRGKDSDKHEGHALSTIKTRSRRMDRFYRWVWDQNGNYTLNITTDHADAWMDHLARKDASGAHKANCQKALKSLYKWRHHERGGSAWVPSIQFSEGQASQPKDYLTREERVQIRETALEYGSVPTYSNLSLTEQDRWRTHLAQRFEKSKDDIVPADWERANGLKIPSLVWTSLDAGLRPIEVERARPEWVDTETVSCGFRKRTAPSPTKIGSLDYRSAQRECWDDGLMSGVHTRCMMTETLSG